MKVRILLKLKIALLTTLLFCVFAAKAQQHTKPILLEGFDTNYFQSVFIPLKPLHTVANWSYSEQLPEKSLDLGINTLGQYVYLEKSINGLFYSSKSVNKKIVDFTDSLLYNQILGEKLVFSNFAAKSTIVEKFNDEDLPQKDVVGMGNIYRAYKNVFFKENVQHSMSFCSKSYGNKPKIYIYFRGIEAKDKPVFDVLCAIANQLNATFQTNFVKSGLALRANLTNNPMQLGDMIIFEIEPNPFGIKQAIEAFFSELYAMPLFDYTSKEQLDLAKEQIAIDVEFAKDRFSSYANFMAGFYSNNLGDSVHNYLDSVNVVTKVDMMNFIRKYLHKQPFLLYIEADEKSYADAEKYIYTTKKLDAYNILFENEKSSNLNKNAILTADSIVYILNLTSWASIDVVLNGKAKKRVKTKRAKAIEGYLKSKNISNNLRFILKSEKGKENTESIIFLIRLIEN